ncbi:MAG: N-acetylmuramic acid 6-phosphate etherase [Chitinophagaceae bacterium]|nr:N-acetylmuramic acid 6-phosphate etherase [Chitinophagaceae bacterium]
MQKITEQKSPYRHLDKMSIEQITACINQEDKGVPLAIEKALPQINRLIEKIVATLKSEGRLFYVGAGSGGRLSVLDVIELPTTYGISKGVVNVILAGGTDHLVEALEEKEDDTTGAWEEMKKQNISSKDMVVGISASGTTPFVLAALQQCKAHGIATGCIVSNPGSPIAGYSDFPVEVITGPEFVSGSTRMKCGSAQKMIFDMISTTAMIQLGRVEDNSMVNVKLINNKIIDRAVKMLMEKTQISDYNQAKSLLIENGSVKAAYEFATARRNI